MYLSASGIGICVSSTLDLALTQLSYIPALAHDIQRHFSPVHSHVDSLVLFGQVEFSTKLCFSRLQ